MIRTFAALAAVLTVGAVQAADMNMDMSGHEHHMMAGDHSMHMAAQSPAVQAVGVVKAIELMQPTARSRLSMNLLPPCSGRP